MDDGTICPWLSIIKFQVDDRSIGPWLSIVLFSSGWMYYWSLISIILYQVMMVLLTNDCLLSCFLVDNGTTGPWLSIVLFQLDDLTIDPQKLSSIGFGDLAVITRLDVSTR